MGLDIRSDERKPLMASEESSGSDLEGDDGESIGPTEALSLSTLCERRDGVRLSLKEEIDKLRGTAVWTDIINTRIDPVDVMSKLGLVQFPHGSRTMAKSARLHANTAASVMVPTSWQTRQRCPNQYYHRLAWRLTNLSRRNNYYGQQRF